MTTALLLLALQSDVSESRLRERLEKLVSFGTRSSLSEEGIVKAREWLKAEFEKTKLKVAFHDFNLRLRTGNVPQKNVWALLEGTKHPKKLVVFGAHYDSINVKDPDPDGPAPGANDNGSGTVAVLEAATLLAERTFPISIAFVCFSTEEQGLLGAGAFVKMLEDQGYEVVGMINNDIVGGVDDAKEKNENDCRVFADPEHEPSSQMMRWAKIVAESKVKGFRLLLQPRIDRPGRGGDHIQFSRRKMPAIRLIETHENLDRQHNANDTVEHVQFAYLKKMVEVDLALIECLASAPAVPEWAEGFSWKAVAGAEAYLVARRGDGIDFEEIVKVKGTSFQPGKPGRYSVAAVDAKGNVSRFTSELSR